MNGVKVDGAQFSVTTEGGETIEANGNNSRSGIVFWVPMFEAFTVTEERAPEWYMESEPLTHEAIYDIANRAAITPETYDGLTTNVNKENEIVYTDSKYPVIEVQKFNYQYDESANESHADQVYDPDQVPFKLYKKTEENGELKFELAETIYDYESDSYGEGFANGRTIQILPGESYYYAEEYTGSGVQEGFINPAWLEGSSASEEGVIYQDGMAYYPLPELIADHEKQTFQYTNYHNQSGSLQVKVEEMRLQEGFAEGTVEISAEAVGSDGIKYGKTVEVANGFPEHGYF